MNYSKITAATTDAKYIAAPEEILAVEQSYLEYENELQSRINSMKANNPGYGDYVEKVDHIGHDPYVLLSICSAIKPDFSFQDEAIQELLEKLRQPRRQYTLTTETEIIDESSDELDRLNQRFVIKLTNYDLSCTIDSLLNHEQLTAYAGYIRQRGSRPDLFPPDKYPDIVQLPVKFDYQVSKDTLDKYPMLNKLLSKGTQFVGYPYIWGGSSPETSFDCSGLICYLLDSIGLRYRNEINGVERRLPVAGSMINGVYYDGLYDKCKKIDSNNRQPGDLIFFAGTFAADYRPSRLTHVGVYCGDDVFFACTSPVGVSFSRLDDISSVGVSWRDLLVGYGRLQDVE